LPHSIQCAAYRPKGVSVLARKNAAAPTNLAEAEPGKPSLREQMSCDCQGRAQVNASQPDTVLELARWFELLPSATASSAIERTL